MTRRQNRVRLNPKSKEKDMKVPALMGNASKLQYVSFTDQLKPPRRGTRELLKLFSEAPWLRAITGKVGQSVAETDWVLLAEVNSENKYVRSSIADINDSDLFQRKLMEGMDSGELDVIAKHPMLEMFRRGTGNPRLNGFGVFMVTQNHIDIAGEAFWLIERDKLGTPFAIWPLAPQWVKYLPTTTMPYYQVCLDGGQPFDVPVTEMVPFIMPDPFDPYHRGTGVAGALSDEIEIDEFSAKHQKSFFLNRARPDLIISGQHISQSDSQRLEQQWLADHQGFWRAFKPLFFSNQIDVKELSQSFESMQMVQLRRHERDTFVSVYGVPPEKLGIIGESKRSTIAAADFFWNKDVIKPRVELIRRTAQQVLVPQFDERLLLGYITPVVQDQEYQLEVMQRSAWAVTLNEWRREAKKPSLGPAGDMLVIPRNMMLVRVKDEDGNLVDQDEILATNEMTGGVSGEAAQEAAMITSSISDEIARVVGASVDEIKTEIRRRTQQD